MPRTRGASAPQLPSPEIAHLRARVAALSLARDPDDPDLLAARQDLKASRLEEHVREAINGVPPLTRRQRARIAAILRPAS